MPIFHEKEKYNGQTTVGLLLHQEAYARVYSAMQSKKQKSP
jgi:hypothetical protein